MNFTAVARVRFSTPEHAAIAARALAVDDELQPTKAAKDFTTEGPLLVGCVRVPARRQPARASGLGSARRAFGERARLFGAAAALTPSLPAHTAHAHLAPSCLRGCCSHFRASEARVLRVVMSSFYDMLAVTVRTLRDFT
jgi:hypothetical protein